MLPKIQGHFPTSIVLFRVSMFFLGLKLNMRTDVRQMLPMTPQLRLRLHSYVNFTNIFHVCMWTVMSFMFFTFFRKSNVLPLSVQKFDPHMQMCRHDIVIGNAPFTFT